jgi:4-hydroxy-2-oxoheptanedioate aldolase
MESSQVRRSRPLRDRLSARERVVGTFLNLPCERTTEIIGYAGFDFAIADMEHSPIGPLELESIIRAADVTRLPVVVRVADASPAAIARSLDCGASGILVPQIRFADEARQVVRAANYHPLGERGLGLGRAARYGLTELSEYLPAARVAVGVQVETQQAVTAIDEIVGIDGLDFLFVGPLDLSQALGIPGEFQTPQFDATVRRVLEACRAAGRVAGIAAERASDASARFEDGFELVTVGSDAAFLASEAVTTASALLADGTAIAGDRAVAGPSKDGFGTASPVGLS